MITDHCSQFMISHENRLLHSHEDFDATLHSQEFKLVCHWQKKPTASFQENSMFQLALHCAIGLWIISAPWSCNKCSTTFHHIFKQSSDDSAHKNSSRIHNIHIIHSSHTSSWLFIPQQLDGHFGEDKVLRCFEWFEQEDSFLLVVEATWTPFTTKRIEGNQSENRPSQKDNIVSQPPLFRGYVVSGSLIHLVLNHTASSTIRKISNWVGIDGGQAAEGGDLRQLLVKQRQEHFDDPEVAMLEMIMFVILQILTSGSKFSKIWNL